MNDPASDINLEPAARAQFIRDRLPAAGLFAGHEWRMSPTPFSLGSKLATEIEGLGRILLQFYRAANLLYRQSVEGRQPAWVAGGLDQGKPASLIALQRSAAFKNEVPRVIRPDLLITENGLALTELDSVPGGIGLTAWLNQTYTQLETIHGRAPTAELQGGPPPPDGLAPLPPGAAVLGGADGMLRGFAGIFDAAPRVHIVVSEEASGYRPEMVWLASQLEGNRFQVRDAQYLDFAEGEAVYRFFELFDLAHVPNAVEIFERAREKRLLLTPPPKPLFEEKMLLALLWNRNLQDFWRRELGARFFERMLELTPRTWLVDPAPLPPHGAIPELNLTDWAQLKTLSQRQRDLVLKISGFSATAWGARGVFLGSDMSVADWSVAVDAALAGFSQSPYVLQRYHKPKRLAAAWYDFATGQMKPMACRARLCPYYFLAGEKDAVRATLGGVLAALCPEDKKIIHGMTDAIMAPCSL